MPIKIEWLLLYILFTLTHTQWVKTAHLVIDSIENTNSQVSRNLRPVEKVPEALPQPVLTNLSS